MKNILHKFKNTNTGSIVTIEQSMRGYNLVQQNPNGTSQHLKLDENGLCNFLNRTVGSVWEEQSVKC